MRNWKTALAGLVAAAATGYAQGQFTDFKSFLVALPILALGLLAKDNDVTGGNRQQ